jgi:hypothetical protein
MSWTRRQIEPVDATSMHDWEADTASRVGAGLLFWCWYLPADLIGFRRVLRTAIRMLAGGRVVGRYPLDRAPVTQTTARVPVRSR